MILALLLAIVPAVADTIPAIAYHDIVERRGADEFAITVKEFHRQMRYLRKEGYTPVSLRKLDAIRRGEERLPPKPVLLSFDDGLASFAEHALPVLREYGYPAVLAVVTAWVDGRAAPEHYRGRILSWDELRKIAATDGVEIISHSDDLHLGLRANPQGNLAPAVVTREYRGNGRHESEDEFRRRVSADLARSVARLRSELKLSPAAIAWPYGQFDAILVEEAARLGMTYHLTLEDAPTRLNELPRIHRATFHRYRRLSDFDDMLTFRKWRTAQLRFVELALDDFSGLTATEQDQRLSALLARLELLRINTVVVRPFTRDGQKAFFPNPRIPLAADLLNRVLHQIRSRLRVDHVFLRFGEPRDAGDVADVYRELSRLNRFSGVLFETVATTDRVDLLRHYNPMAQVVFPAHLASVRESRLWDEIRADDHEDAIEKRIRKVLAADRNALFVLRRPRDLADDRLIAAMQALRRAGARHYGYDNDEFSRNRPELAKIGPELHAYVAVDNGGR
jgi:peptidoglycan/xylan/chitin deacetylase (PgdA/CDA1 family)